MMETILEAAARLREAGYAADFSATEDGQLRCGACGAEHDPATIVIDQIVRYEGLSDPGDETMLLALRCGCDQRGLYTTAYGANVGTGDLAVLQALP
jgi:hypothetical protein